MDMKDILERMNQMQSKLDNLEFERNQSIRALEEAKREFEEERRNYELLNNTQNISGINTMGGNLIMSSPVDIQGQVQRELQSQLSSVQQNNDQLLAGIIGAGAIRIPYLRSSGKEAIKNFMNDYEEYKFKCGAGAVKKKQQLIIKDIVTQISYMVGESEVELALLDDTEFNKRLVRLVAPVDMNEAFGRFRHINMVNDSLQLDTLLQYNRDWDFEVLCMGDDAMFNQKVLVKKYIHGLKPQALQKVVARESPGNVDEAKKLAAARINELRAARNCQYLFKDKRYEGNSYKGGGGYKSNYNNRGDGVESKGDDKKVNGNGNGYKGNELKSGNGNGNNNGYSSGYGKRKEDLSTVKCFTCGQMGHKMYNCPSKSDNKQDGKERNFRRLIVEEKQFLKCNINDGEDNGIDNLRRVEAMVQGAINTKIFLDSGADFNIISTNFLNKLMSYGLNIQIDEGDSFMVKLGNNDKFSLDGRSVLLNFQIKLADRVLFCEERCHIMNCDEDVIFGLEAISKNDLADCLKNPLSNVQCEEDDVLDVAEEEVKYEPESSALVGVNVNEEFILKDELKELLKEYSEVFGKLHPDGMNVAPMAVKVKDGMKRTAQPCRFVSPKIRPILEENLLQLENDGVIERTDTAVAASPLVIVPKPDGTIRIAVDYRELNNVLETFAGSIPDMKSLFPYVVGNKVYAKIDNLQGYFQLNIAEEDRDNTTIITPVGLFRFRRCPFGLSTAPGVYQNRMNHVVLNGLVPEKCICYIDDTIIFGKTNEEFLENLKLVLERLRFYRVRLKKVKCSFGYSEIDFVGHVFNENGYRLKDEKKNQIMALRDPTNIKELRRVLGLVNFFRDFIENFSNLVKPLTDLTKRTSFSWNEDNRKAWRLIKETVANAGMLHGIEEEGDLLVYTDASIDGIGGVLKQFRVAEGREVPILFISKKFSSAAAKWSTIEQELYAVFYTIMKLRSFLLGRKFVVVTDHHNLIYLQSSTIPKAVRWKLRLLEFDFVIKHIAGKDNVVADALSRLNIMLVDDSNDELDDRSGISQLEMIKSLHNSVVGHHGVSRIEKMLKLIEWEGTNVRRDIISVVSTCGICQKIKRRPVPNVEVPLFTLQGSHPMKKVGIDAVGPLPADDDGNVYILSVVDEFTKFTTLYACKSVQAVEYLDVLLKHISLFGMMDQVRTDGGSQFTAKICKDLSLYLEFKHHVIIPYHPQANGIVERRNGEIMKHLRAIVMERRVKKSWSKFLCIIQNILNNSIDSSLGTYPAKVLFGNMLKTNIEWIVSKNRDVQVQTLDNYIGELDRMMKIICEESNKYMKDKFEKKKSKVKEIGGEVTTFEIGDYVLVTYPTQPPSKLAPIYRGPLIIIEKVREDIYKCRDIVSNKVITFHVDRLREFKVSPDVTPDELLEWASTDKDEFGVEAIVEHRGTGKRGDPLEFKVRWKGYSEEEDSWISFKEANLLEALDVYEASHPDLLKYQNKKIKKK